MVLNEDYGKIYNILSAKSFHIGSSDRKVFSGDFTMDELSDNNLTFSQDSEEKYGFVQCMFNGLHKLVESTGNKNLVEKDIFSALITGLDLHDRYTRGHSEAVSLISLKIGKSMGLSKSEINDLYLAALVHDIGKVIIPSKILNKPTKLTNEEYSLIKKHSKAGFDILINTTLHSNIAYYVLYHHERWDGKGYPSGISGCKIPKISQIISVADAWNAMTSKRPYKEMVDKNSAIQELMQNRGTQFSPEVVDAYITILENEFKNLGK